MVSASGKYPGCDEGVVDLLLFRIEPGVQQVVSGFFTEEDLDRVPVGAERFHHVGAPECLVGGEVEREVDRRGRGRFVGGHVLEVR